MVQTLYLAQLECVNGQADITVAGEPYTVVPVVDLVTKTDTIDFNSSGFKLAA